MTQATTEVRERTCLLLIPNSGVQRAIAEALEEAGISPIQDEFGGVRSFFDVVPISSIERANMIIADITGSNPNVMYGLGFAHALRKPVLIIVQEREEITPFDIRGFFYLVYDPSDLGDFQNMLRQWILRLWPTKRAE